MRFGFLELVVVLAIVALVFGPKQIPKLTKAVSDSISSFRSELKTDGEDGDSTEGDSGQ